MFLQTAHCYWKVGRGVYPFKTLWAYAKRVQFFLIALKEQPLRKLSQYPANPLFDRAVKERPSILAILVGPYQHCDWGVAERFKAVFDHYTLQSVWGFPWIDTCSRAVLVDLAAYHPELTIQLHRPHWMMREGELTLSLFMGDFRAYSLAFSWAEVSGRKIIRIGSIQGRSTPGVMDIYTALTKSLHGCRPRDLLITVMQVLAQSLDVNQIWAISSASQHHNHRFFKGKEYDAVNYDTVWLEREGVLMENGFFLLPPIWQVRTAESILSKKRAVYRRRYEMFSQIQTDVLNWLPLAANANSSAELETRGVVIYRNEVD